MKNKNKQESLRLYIPHWPCMYRKDLPKYCSVCGKPVIAIPNEFISFNTETGEPMYREAVACSEGGKEHLHITSLVGGFRDSESWLSKFINWLFS